LTANSTAALTALRAEAGLTDSQLGRLFGVAPRTLHYWMHGGRMGTPQTERLAEVATVVAALPGTTPAEKRSAILASSMLGRSAFDELRSTANSGQEINAPLSPLILLGVGRFDDDDDDDDDE
jgi:transcriptional regulator with XRE-family HTH domain